MSPTVAPHPADDVLDALAEAVTTLRHLSAQRRWSARVIAVTDAERECRLHDASRADDAAETLIYSLGEVARTGEFAH